MPSLTVDRLSCSWQRCYLQRIQLAKDQLSEITFGGCIANERMLAEWLLWHRYQSITSSPHLDPPHLFSTPPLCHGHRVPIGVLATAGVADALWSRATPSAPLQQSA